MEADALNSSSMLPVRGSPHVAREQAPYLAD